MWSLAFWKDTAERVISTAAQAAVGAIGATILVSEINWEIVGSAVGIAALTSLLKCLIASRKGDAESASLVK